MKAWIDAGELTQRVAELVRSLWAEQGDRPFHIDDLAMPDGGSGRLPRISEIAPPLQPQVVVRKGPSPLIEGEALQPG
jgi:hypothetical protein